MKLHKSKEAVICALLGLRNIVWCTGYAFIIGVLLDLALSWWCKELNIRNEYVGVAISLIIISIPALWIIDTIYKDNRIKRSLDSVTLWVSYALFPVALSFIVSYPRIRYSDLSNGDKAFLFCISPLWIFPVFAAIKELFGLYRDKAETDK